MGDALGTAEAKIIAAIDERSRRSGTCPVSTTTDIADAINVSAQTVRNHIDGAIAKSRIQRGTIRGADVFWVDIQESVDSPSESEGNRVPPITDAEDEIFFGSLWEHRGYWQGVRQKLRRDEAVGAPPTRRVQYLWEVFRYIENGAPESLFRTLLIIQSGEVADVVDADQDAVYEMASPRVSEEQMRYYLSNKSLFEVEAYGEVTGLAEFGAEYSFEVLAAFEGESGEFDLTDLSDDEIDAWVPDCGQILEAGDAWDDFVSELYGVWW